MQQNVTIMNERTILDTVQRWRRSKYSARPFALTILAITLITLLAWAKELRGAAPAGAAAGTSLHKRELTALDVEVGQHSAHNCARIYIHAAATDRTRSAASSTMPTTSAPSSSPTAPMKRPVSSPT